MEWIVDIITNMEDKEAAKVLQSMLQKYGLTDEEQEALRQAIGVLAWTKLVEGFNERRKKGRDKKMKDLDDSAN